MQSPWSLSSISDVSFLANWLNVIPAVLYVLASLLGVIGSKFQNEVNLFDSPIEDSRGTLLAVGAVLLAFVGSRGHGFSTTPCRLQKRFGSWILCYFIVLCSRLCDSMLWHQNMTVSMFDLLRVFLSSLFTE